MLAAASLDFELHGAGNLEPVFARFLLRRSQLSTIRRRSRVCRSAACAGPVLVATLARSGIVSSLNCAKFAVSLLEGQSDAAFLEPVLGFPCPLLRCLAKWLAYVSKPLRPSALVVGACS